MTAPVNSTSISKNSIITVNKRIELILMTTCAERKDLDPSRTLARG